LPSKCPCLCHRRAPSKGLCHRGAFAIEGPLPSRGLCHRGTFAIKVPFP
jgi:hypothetical protein